MIHFDASRAKHQSTERNRYSLVAWINLLYYLTCPNTDLLGIIPSRFGGKINFLGGLPVYFSLNKLGQSEQIRKIVSCSPDRITNFEILNFYKKN